MKTRILSLILGVIFSISAHAFDKMGVECKSETISKNDKAKMEFVDNLSLEGKIVDPMKRLSFYCKVDLRPTIDRIQKKVRLNFRNDGSLHSNLEGHLPRQTFGYYKEYVIQTPGVNGPGVQRLIVGKNGEMCYTPDHYKTCLLVPDLQPSKSSILAR